MHNRGLNVLQRSSAAALSIETNPQWQLPDTGLAVIFVEIQIQL